MKDFSEDLQEEGLITIQAEAHISPEICFEFSVLAGLAEGTAGRSDIDQVFREGREGQREIARVHCEKGR